MKRMKPYLLGFIVTQELKMLPLIRKPFNIPLTEVITRVPSVRRCERMKTRTNIKNS